MAEIKVATDANFEELVLKAERPVVVDFWAAWCGPCKMVAPEMEKLAAKYDGAVDVVKVDVDANPRLSQAFNILSIPTIAFFKPGAQPQGVVGLPPARAARAAVRPDGVRGRSKPTDVGGDLTRSSSRERPRSIGSGSFEFPRQSAPGSVCAACRTANPSHATARSTRGHRARRGRSSPSPARATRRSRPASGIAAAATDRIEAELGARLADPPTTATRLGRRRGRRPSHRRRPTSRPRRHQRRTPRARLEGSCSARRRGSRPGRPRWSS